MVDMNAFGNRLRLLREEKELTQIDLAKTLSIANSTISQYEAGNRMPDAHMLERLATFFNVSVDYLLGRTDIQRPEETPPFDYNIIYKQRDEGDAYLVVRELQKKYNLSKETVYRMIDDIAKFYEEKQEIEGGKLADGPKSPGSGAFDEDDRDGDS